MSDAPEPPGMLDVRMSGPVAITVRIQWWPGSGGRNAIRAQDRELWLGALWCQRCNRLGYNHDDIDAVLEAHRLSVDHAPRVAACSVCGALACDACGCCS